MASSSVYGANMRLWTNSLSKTWGEYSNICPWTNTFSNTWGEYSSVDEYFLENMGEYPSVDEYFLENMGEYSSVDEYFLENMGEYSSVDEKYLENVGRIFVHRLIFSRKHGANIRGWTNATYSTDGFREYSSKLFVFVRGVQS